MTIFGDERLFEYPVMNMFDNQLLLANVSAAKDMYDQAQKQQQDFMNKYGEFVSPNKNDTQNWYNITTGRVADVLDQMRKANIDPPRSQEGRSMVAYLINTMPYGEMSKMRERSALMQEYEKNRAELEAKGLYNPNYEKFRLGGKTIENWDANKDGDWTSTSPAQFQDLYGATNKWFEGMQPKYDAVASKATGGRQDVYTVSNNDLFKVASQQLDSFKNSQLGAYYYDQAKQQVKAYNPNLNDNQISEAANGILSHEIVGSNGKALRYEMKSNEYALNTQRHSYDVDMENRRFGHESQLEDKKLQNQLNMYNLKHKGTTGNGTDPIGDIYKNGVNSYLNSLGFSGNFSSAALNEQDPGKIQYINKNIVDAQKNKIKSFMCNRQSDGKLKPANFQQYNSRVANWAFNTNLTTKQISTALDRNVIKNTARNSTKDQASSSTYSIGSAYDSNDIQLTGEDKHRIYNIDEITPNIAAGGNYWKGRTNAVYKGNSIRNGNVKWDGGTFTPATYNGKYNTAAVHMNDGKIHIFAYGTFSPNGNSNKSRTGAIDLGISNYAPENRSGKTDFILSQFDTGQNSYDLDRNARYNKERTTAKNTTDSYEDQEP